MPVWDNLLTEDERKVYEVFRQPKTLGTRPAILVIDVNYAFVGRKPEHIVESVQDYRTSCGARAGTSAYRQHDCRGDWSPAGGSRPYKARGQWLLRDLPHPGPQRDGH